MLARAGDRRIPNAMLTACPPSWSPSESMATAMASSGILASLGIVPLAVSEARASGPGEPYDGHRLLVVEVEATEVAATAALAVSWHGLLRIRPIRNRSPETRSP